MSTKPRARRTDGLKAAYGRRKRWAERVRYFTFRVLKNLGKRPRSSSVDFLEVYPPVRSEQEFADLTARIQCYLGDIDTPLYLPGTRPELDASAASYMDPKIVTDPGWLGEKPDGNAMVLVHRTSPRSIAKTILHRGGRVVNVDVHLHASNESQYWNIRAELAPPNFPSPEESFDRIQKKFGGSSSAFVLATGPSMHTVDLAGVSEDVRITCNSAIRDKKLIADYRPNLIAFTDPVFHFGPSRYAEGFRTDVVDLVRETDAMLLCSALFVSPLLHLHPELEPNLAVLPVSDGEWRWPTKQDPSVHEGSSVLTNLMLPIAFALADTIAVAGADGRRPEEKYFWTHGTQYSDELMKTVFDAHPSFFRDRDYADYYEEYCRELEDLIGAAEGAGKSVRAAAPSWIPALRLRGAAEPALN